MNYEFYPLLTICFIKCYEKYKLFTNSKHNILLRIFGLNATSIKEKAVTV